MAWGYEKCFTIEHDNTLKHKIDCKDCIYYDSSDKSCMKRPLYLPVDGYNSWHRCKYFELDSDVSHYDEKNEQYLRSQGKVVKEQKNQLGIHGTLIKKADRDRKNRAEIGKRILNDGYTLCIVEILPVGKKNIRKKIIKVKLFKNDYREIEIAFDATQRRIFISNKAYTKETIEALYQLLNSRKNWEELLK